MVRTGWKTMVGAMTAAAMFAASGVASAQPGDARSVALPRLEMPRIDVHAVDTRPAPVKLDPATAVAVGKIVAAIHRQQVAPASVAPPKAASAVSASAGKATGPARARKTQTIAIEAKPAPIVSPSIATDSHGFVGSVPGISIRMPWRVP
jgi:hypothetical protein